MIKKGLYILLSIITIGFNILNNTSSNLTIEYKNIEVVKASNDFTINETKEGINYNIDLIKPGDYYEFKVDLANNSRNDVKIVSINNTSLNKEQEKYLDYKISYLDNSQIKINDIISANSKKIIKIIIYFKEDIEVNDLPKKDEIIDLYLDINIMPID